ncbi:MAG TPA: glycosyltransferase [Terriglobales bacterium]|nr:glycosyltransferase [Terriglobales bacterium]
MAAARADWGGGERRRVVWLLDGLGLGGAERLAVRFAAAVPPGWQVELVGLRTEPDPAGVWGAAWAPLAGHAHQVGLRRLADPAGWWRLLRLLRQLRPALVHTHLRYATISGGAAARWLGVPYVATVHVGPQPEPGLRQQAAAALERASRRRAARVIYVGAAQRAAWNARGERAVVIANGVEAPPPAAAPRAERRRALGMPAEAWVLATVAVVRAAKGWRTWLRAAERIAARQPRAWLVWVGGGPELELLRRAAAASPWAARLQLPGPRADVAAWLGAADLFLFPSEQEAQPTAVLEAMAAGLPVVASDLPAIAELLAGCGLLVPAGDDAALAAQALGLDGPAAAPRRRALAEAARRRAAERFGEAAWRERLLQLYAEVTDGEREHGAAAPTAAGGVLLPRRPAAL